MTAWWKEEDPMNSHGKFTNDAEVANFMKQFETPAEIEYDAKMCRLQPLDMVDVEAVKQEIRELNSLEFDSISPELADLVYHRINELLDLLDLRD